MPVGSIGQDHGSNGSSRWWSPARAALERTGGFPHMIGCIFHWSSIGSFAEPVFELSVSLPLHITATSKTVAPDLSPLETWTQGRAGGVLAFLLVLLWATLPLLPVLSSATLLAQGILSSSVAIWPGSNMTFLQALSNFTNHYLTVPLVLGRSPSFLSLRGERWGNSLYLQTKTTYNL